MERALRQQRQLVIDGGLADTFYFRADDIASADPEITEADIMAITREMNPEIERTGISGEVNVRVVQQFYSRTTDDAIMGTPKLRAPTVR